MKKLIAVLALLMLFLLGSLSRAGATSFSFSGKLESLSASSGDLGLGLALGDPFNGSFSYGGALSAIFPNVTLTAPSVQTRVHLFDGHITWVDIMGEIEAGLFLHIGFTNGFEVLSDTSPPLNLSCDVRAQRVFAVSHGLTTVSTWRRRPMPSLAGCHHQFLNTSKPVSTTGSL